MRGFLRTPGAKWFASFAAIAIAMVGAVVWRSVADRRALEEQIALARKEGLPITWQDFAATVPKIPPSQNAAIEYAKLDRHTGDSRIRVAIEADPSAANQTKARQLLHDQAANLALMDAAQAKPSCVFARDWSLGGAVLMPEYATMKAAADLIAVRACLEARDGSVEKAIADCREVMHVNDQLESEPPALSGLVGEAIRQIGITALATFALQHPKEPRYLQALALVASDTKPAVLSKAVREGPFELLSVLDLSTTPQGRADLGLKEEDVSGLERILPIFLSQTRAKANAIAIYREMWAEAHKPQPSGTRIEDLNDQIVPATAAYPTGSDIWDKLNNGFLSDIFSGQQDRQVRTTILLRAIADPRKAPDLSGLKCSDGSKPIYSFDGKHIRITAADNTLSIPPNPNP